MVSNGNNSPTPVTVVSTSQLLKVTPSTVVEALNLVPAIQGSQSTSSNPGGGQRNGAGAYINLRNMGDLRTLVLMDGHRVVPTINQNEANVDSWVIPQLLIKRVDVVTGGVSAVYGSDAVSGAVNFVTDTSFEGVKFQASSGISTYNDDPQHDIGVAVGRKFAQGRGHIELSYEWHKDEGILNQNQRPWFAKAYSAGGLGTSASPYYPIANTRISTTSFGGLVTSGAYNNYQFGSNGVLSPFNTGTAGSSSGGDGGWYDTASIKSGIEFHQIFGRGDYDFTDGIHGYLQIAATFNHTDNSYRAPLETFNIAANNPYLLQVPQLAGLYNANSTASAFSFSKLFNIPAIADQYTDTYMIHGGLNGNLGGYKWELGFGQSQSIIRAVNEANVNQGNFLAASNVVAGPGGTPVCAASLTNSAYAGCVPLNPFGPTAASQQALGYVMEQTWNRNRTRLTEFSGAIHGAPFDTWAGPVTMALSAEWRRTGWSVTSNASPTDPVNCGGIQINCSATTAPYLQTTMPALAAVHQDVAEVAYETQVPLLRDKPFAHSLEVNGALRYTHYSTSGGVVTWKAGLVWRPDSDVTIRGTASRDIRAPNLFELYAPTTTSPTTVVDPISGASGRVGVATASNNQLTPEKAQSFTGGFVWSPHFIPHFSLSVDSYYIRVSNAISQLSGISSSVINGLCGTVASATANTTCGQLIVRSAPTAFPSLIYNQYLNIASFKTWGLDFETNYHTDISGHALVLRGLLGWQPHLVYNQGPAGIIDLGNAATGVSLYPATPAIKFTVLADFYVTKNFDIAVLERGRGAMKAVAVNDGLAQKVFVNGLNMDPATAYTNLTLTWHIPVGGNHDNMADFYVNVQNLLNKQPNLVFAGPNSSPGLGLGGFFPPNGDDIVGRYFTVGLRAHF